MNVYSKVVEYVGETDEGLVTLQEITEELMQKSYDSLSDAEKEIFTSDADEQKPFVYAKVISRCIDMAKKVTYVDDAGVLHLTGSSTILELNIDNLTWCEMIQKHIVTIAELYQAVLDDSLSVDSLHSISTALMELQENTKVVLEV